MIIFVVWYCRDLFVFNIFLYLNLCGKNCFLKKLVGQNVRQTFVFVRQFLRWVGQCPIPDRYFKHWGCKISLAENICCSNRTRIINSFIDIIRQANQYVNTENVNQIDIVLNMLWIGFPYRFAQHLHNFSANTTCTKFTAKPS